MITVTSLTGRKILDSRGFWTLEVVLGLSNGLKVTASVPQGESRGKYEAFVMDPDAAVKIIARKIAPALKKLRTLNVNKVDAMLCALDGTSNKERLGGNTTLGVSVAVARAEALIKGVPLWRYLRSVGKLSVPRGKYPRLCINLIEGGLHAKNNIDFQEYLVIPKKASLAKSVTMGVMMMKELERVFYSRSGKGIVPRGDESGFAPNLADDAEPFKLLERVVRKLGFEKRVAFGLDAAGTNVKLSRPERLKYYRLFQKRYGLSYLEDPFGENNFADFRALTDEFKKTTVVVGDDLTVTNVFRMARAAKEGAISGVIIKPNQIGTVSEALEAVRFARREGWAVIASHRGSETTDDFIADFACGVGADGLKLGAPARGERVAKYNRLLAIEREL